MAFLNLCTSGPRILWPGLAGLALLVSGCSQSEGTADRGRAFTPVLPAQPPAMVTGAMAVLLTNRTGYSAHVDAQTESLIEQDRTVSGQLLCRGTKLFFAPETTGGSKKQTRAGGFSFIWDVASSSGYVLSEVLQGYAPVAAAAHVTNVVTGPGQAAPEKIAGYPCNSEMAAVQLDNGSTANFHVMRASALEGFPVRLNSFTNAVPLTATFSKIRLEPPPAELFALPEGFTKYASPEAMSDEIAIRQRNLRRRENGLNEPLQLPPTGPSSRY